MWIYQLQEILADMSNNVFENEQHMLDKANTKSDTLIVIRIRLPNIDTRNYTALKPNIRTEDRPKYAY